MRNTTKASALIVGGSSGIGYSTARLLLEQGIHAIIIGKSPAKLESAKQRLSSIGQVETLQANLYEFNDIQRVVDWVADYSSAINYLVNAAGYFNPKPFLEHTPDGSRYVLKPQSSHVLYLSSRSKTYGCTWRWSDRQHRIYVGQASSQSHAIFCLFDGEGRIACPYSTYGRGIGR